MGTKSEMSDGFVGMIVLVGSLFLLCVCLAALVKLLKSILKGRIAMWMYQSVNGDFKDVTLGHVTIPMKGLAGYISMATGFALTIMVQSSSITTSAMTPLVGLGVINLERIYPLVLGANMGTTVTGILAALASCGTAANFTWSAKRVRQPASSRRSRIHRMRSCPRQCSCLCSHFTL